MFHDHEDHLFTSVYRYSINTETSMEGCSLQSLKAQNVKHVSLSGLLLNKRHNYRIQGQFSRYIC